MGEAAKMSSRGWLAAIVGSTLLGAGLLALAVPVVLGEYDRYGIAIECGNGFRSHLAQAAAEDLNPQSTLAPSRVDQCTSALALRRAAAVPVASLGAVILVPTVVTWARARAAAPNAPTPADTPWSSAHPDSAIHDAAVLDRRERQHRHRPSNTTL